MQAYVKELIAKIRNDRWVRFALAVLARFGKDNGTLNAAGLAFFMLLSFAPMILAGVAMLSRIIAPSLAIKEVQSIVDNLMPAGGARAETSHFLGDKLAVTLDQLSRKGLAASIVGLLTLIWTSMQIFVTGSTAVNSAFECQETRGWFRLRVTAFGLFAGSGILLAISLLLSGLPDLPPIKEMSWPPVAISTLTEFAAVLVNAVLFAIIYRYLPASHTQWKSAFVGGAAASVLFEIAKKGIATLLLRPNNTIYGGLADLIVFILWIYYSMSILLLGSEVAAVHALNERPGAGSTLHGHQPSKPRRVRGKPHW